MEINEQSFSTRVFLLLACFIGFLGSLYPILFSFTEVAYMIGPRYNTFLKISSLLLWVSFIAIWKMKKWGVFLYTSVIIAIQIVEILYNDIIPWSYSSLILPIIVILIIGFQFKKMS